MGSLYQSGQPKLSCAPAQLRYEINVAITPHRWHGSPDGSRVLSWPAARCPRIDTEPARTGKGVAMTKNELADRVAQRIGIAAEQVRQALDASFDAVADELASGGEVALAGFGKFSVSHRSARQGRSPSTGETIQIAPSSQPKFSSASALKKRLNP